MSKFEALEVALIVIERLTKIEAKIRLRSVSLAEQIGEAGESIALNLGESGPRRDGDKRRHYEFAAGSASEVTVGLRIAVARKYITEADRAWVEEPLDRLRAMVFRMNHPRR